MTEEKFETIKAQFTSAELVQGKNYSEIIVKNEELKPLLLFLKEDNSYSYNYLFCMTAVDWLDYFTLVYHLENTDNQECLVVKTMITGRENPTADSMYEIWAAAEFYEREVFDLFGINFSGHPDLRRIFLEDDWLGYPLRKDYTDEINIIER